MALTRRMLKAMGIEEDKADQIIDAHMETVDQLKHERDSLKEDTAKVTELESTIADLKKQLQEKGEDDWEAMYNAEHKALEDLKAAQEKQAEEARKRSLYTELLRESGIEDRGYIDSILNVTDFSKLEADEDGLKSTDELKKAVSDKYGAFVAVKSVKGAEVPNPPQSTGGIAGANPEVMKRLQERHERLYGKAETKENSE